MHAYQAPDAIHVGILDAEELYVHPTFDIRKPIRHVPPHRPFLLGRHNQHVLELHALARSGRLYLGANLLDRCEGGLGRGVTVNPTDGYLEDANDVLVLLVHIERVE